MELRAGRPGLGELGDVADERLGGHGRGPAEGFPRLFGVRVGRQARGMGQQMPDPGVFGRVPPGVPVGTKSGNVHLDPVPKGDLPPLRQDHDRRRRGDGLGDRGQVEDRVDGHRLVLRNPLAFPIGPPEDGLPFPGHEEDGPRELLALDRVVDDRVDAIEALGRHADVVGRGRRKGGPAAAEGQGDPEDDQGRGGAAEGSVGSSAFLHDPEGPDRPLDPLQRFPEERPRAAEIDALEPPELVAEDFAGVEK